MMPAPPRITWPEGKRFAFTVFDDADYDRLDNVRPVYDFLGELGIHTTKSVWTLAATQEARLSGLSTELPEYLAWAQSLQRAGFELGLHGVRCHSSLREETQRGLDLFRAQFGHDPKSFSNHFQNADSIYWGEARLRGVYRAIYRLANLRSPLRAEGHLPESPYFWGDLCRERVTYVRNFVYRDINTLAACPWMPYHDPEFPWVKAWYASAEGADLESFVRLLDEANQDRLLAEGGACIVYTHFAKRFFVDGQLNPRFVDLMKRLAGLGGWFVPVGTLLDFLAEKQGGIHPLTSAERNALQRQWLVTKLRHGSS
jgi:hypothetical protein